MASFPKEAAWYHPEPTDQLVRQPRPSGSHVGSNARNQDAGGTLAAAPEGLANRASKHKATLAPGPARAVPDRTQHGVAEGLRRVAAPADDGYVHVRGAREHNLKNIDLDIPRDALVVFTGVSGSGKSSLAFGTLYAAEAQRRYLKSVSPYARRLFHQLAVPDVDEIDGLPPAVALQQQRGTPSTRSSVGSVTTLSNLLRMLQPQIQRRNAAARCVDGEHRAVGTEVAPRVRETIERPQPDTRHHGALK